jgi:hypothetical protein
MRELPALGRFISLFATHLVASTAIGAMEPSADPLGTFEYVRGSLETLRTPNACAVDLGLRGKTVYGSSDRCLTAYSETIALSSLPKEKVTSILQLIARELHGKGYRKFGALSDLFHGHLLWESSAAEGTPPFAILFHTQENLGPDVKPVAKPVFFNPDGRNWLLFLGPPLRLENAALYENTEDRPEWREYRKVHTITDRMLDPRKLGKDFVREDVPGKPWSAVAQFNFLAVRCPRKIAPWEATSNLVRIQVPGEGLVCLDLPNNDCAIYEQRKCPPCLKEAPSSQATDRH